MKAFTTRLLLVFVVTSSCHAADLAPGILSSKLKALAGPESQDCGSVPLGNDRRTTFTCAKHALAAGTAFRVALQYQGVDSFIWQGAARDEHGRLWLLSYDSDPSGGSQVGAVLNVASCSKIQVVAVQGRDDMNCTPASGP